MTRENKLENPSQKKVKRGSLLNEFFWICSGANREILRQCPTEYSKYFGIGAIIFFTAVMAALSGAYAFHIIFKDNNILALCFGIFWGILIFNIDRFIVNTMYFNGKHTISWSEFKSGLPRIVIAIFLGIVISTPLEMKIFEDRIESQIVKDNAKISSETQVYLQEKTGFSVRYEAYSNIKNDVPVVRNISLFILLLFVILLLTQNNHLILDILKIK